MPAESTSGVMQVSVDVPWSPFGIDGRNFDWSGLAAAADLLFVMAYDTQSQVLLPFPVLAIPHTWLTSAVYQAVPCSVILMLWTI